jgi:ATP-dependent protease Clp ATPase subunit
MRFTKAVRKTAKARIALVGPSGSGKTWGALVLAAGLGGRVGVIDAEKGSASLYVGLEGIPDFDTLELAAPYTPERTSTP